MLTHPAPSGSLLTRPLLMTMAAAAGGLLGFYLLFAAMPLYAASGGAGETGVGLTTGVMMLSTVLLELAVPWLLSRYGYRAVLALGLVLLGLPALLLPLSAGLPLVLAVALLRGGGLGILVVAGTALAAELVPTERRGEGLGLYGVAVGVPSVIGLPLGLWAAGVLGFTPVLVVGGLIPLAGLVAVLGLPALRPAIKPAAGPSVEPSATFDLRSQMRPTLIFAAVTLAVGVLVTFLPLAGSPELASGALLAQSLGTPLARWWAGKIGDGHGSERLLVPGVLVTAVGVALQVWSAEPVAVVAGMALFGVGFGVLQNATLALMLERGPSGPVSALWNLAYDAGMGVGAMGFGLFIGHTGYPVGFAVTAALVAATLPLALRRTR
ncbi:MFS transporter [Nonomuraea aurantiaca]|jgi:MFS family permease|uniref:MFS transporter n=1 Tax=Nonomuraea aurantiaca TaxID=2878562 RepID=UPI001CD9AFF9|nr:MFS transporter [Nonomuraea aurantiaca]MCA2223291.1 MFS transporter [Nonomuraea aurantiaca]